MPQFEVWDASDWEVFSDETEGAEEKWWLISPADGRLWLFKPPVDKFGFRQGEDWAERVSTELARAIRVPCADVELGHRDGRRGSMSRRLQPRGWDIQPGKLLLAEFDPGYVSQAKGRPGHSLERIAAALTGARVAPPLDGPDGFSAFDVFAGYMVLDALIANRDRHDDNWSVLVPPPGGTPVIACVVPTISRAAWVTTSTRNWRRGCSVSLAGFLNGRAMGRRIGSNMARKGQSRWSITL